MFGFILRRLLSLVPVLWGIATLVFALIYYVTTAPDFGTALLGVIKALLWPAFLVYGLLFFIGA